MIVLGLVDSLAGIERNAIVMRTQANAGTTVQIPEDRASLHEVYLQHRPELCAYLVKKLGFIPSEAEDVVQTVFEKAMQMKPEQFDNIRNYRAFLYKATHNAGVDYQRHQAVGKRYVDETNPDAHKGSDDIDPYRNLVASQELAMLAQALKKMPERRRKLIIMNRFDGLSYAEIARRVDLSETVVRKHVSRALADCLQALRLNKRDIVK